MILLESQGATLNQRMGDFDGRHNTDLPVGTPKNGSKVLNRNNLRATRPNGEASLHVPCELIRNNITSIAPCCSTFFFLRAKPAGPPVLSRCRFFPKISDANVQSKAVLTIGGEHPSIGMTRML
jgi:hypothetical protein